jgi:hypothetical protein
MIHVGYFCPLPRRDPAVGGDVPTAGDEYSASMDAPNE